MQQIFVSYRAHSSVIAHTEIPQKSLKNNGRGTSIRQVAIMKSIFSCDEPKPNPAWARSETSTAVVDVSSVPATAPGTETDITTVSRAWLKIMRDPVRSCPRNSRSSGTCECVVRAGSWQRGVQVETRARSIERRNTPEGGCCGRKSAPFVGPFVI